MLTAEELQKITPYVLKDFSLTDVMPITKYPEIKQRLREIAIQSNNKDLPIEIKNEYDQLIAEIERCTIIFNSEEHFILFSKSKVRPEKWDAVIKHELEHATIYKKYNIPVKYGFHKFKDQQNAPCYRPCVKSCFDETTITEKERLKIEIEALKNAAIPSDQDKLDIEYKEKQLHS